MGAPFGFGCGVRIEGLFAVYDLAKREVVRVVDTGAIPLPTDPWGYTEDEIAAFLTALAKVRRMLA